MAKAQRTQGTAPGKKGGKRNTPGKKGKQVQQMVVEGTGGLPVKKMPYKG